MVIAFLNKLHETYFHIKWIYYVVTTAEESRLHWQYDSKAAILCLCLGKQQVFNKWTRIAISLIVKTFKRKILFMTGMPNMDYGNKKIPIHSFLHDGHGIVRRSWDDEVEVTLPLTLAFATIPNCKAWLGKGTIWILQSIWCKIIQQTIVWKPETTIHDTNHKIAASWCVYGGPLERTSIWIIWNILPKPGYT